MSTRELAWSGHQLPASPLHSTDSSSVCLRQFVSVFLGRPPMQMARASFVLNISKLLYVLS